MNKYFCVTSMSKKIYEHFGHLAISTFIKHWPDHIPLIIYDEDNVLEKYQSNKIIIRNYTNIKPFITDMKARNFPKKVVRFANKAYSWLDAVKNPLGTHIIWLDADVATKDTVSQEWLDNVIQDNVSVHIGSEFPKIKHELSSQMYYTCETGFYCLDLLRGQPIVNLYETVYKNSEDYDLRVLYDGDVYGYCVKQFEKDLKMIDLNPKKHHTAFSRIVLKEKLVHWKGKIKKGTDFEKEAKNFT